MTEPLTAATIEELERIVSLLETQDNRITADPIFVVQEKRRRTGLDESYCEKIAWVYAEDPYPEVTAESDLEQFSRLEADDFGDDDPEFWTRTGYVDEWWFVQPFLTLEAAEAFRRQEAHNLKETRVYVESAHRNPEWKWLRAALPALLAATRRVAELPDVGEPEPCKEERALAWEREFREETHHLRIVGASLNPTTEEPIGIRVPNHGIDAEEARYLAACLLAAAAEAEGGGR